MEKKLSEEVPQEDQVYRSIFNNMLEVLYRTDNDERITLISPSALEIFGYDRLDDIIGKNIRDTFYQNPSDRSLLLNELEKHGKVVNYPLVLKKNDGTIVYAKTTSYNIFDKEGNRTGVEGIIMDTSDQYLAEQALQQAADIVANIRLGIYIYQLDDPENDRTLRMISANPATEELTGVPVSEVVGRNLDENFPGLREKGIPKMYADVVRNQKPIEIEEIFYGDDRVISNAFSVKAFPLPNNQVGVSFENITHRKQTEEALRKSKKELMKKNKELEKALNSAKEMHAHLVISEKMASLGQITAGVAHEIKNPLAFIKTNIDPLKRDIQDILNILEKYEAIVIEEDLQPRFSGIESLKGELDFTYLIEEIHKLLEGIKEGANRTTQIVKSLGNFSRAGEEQCVLGNIHDGIDSTLTLLSSEISNRITLRKEYGNLPDIEYYPGKLNQVFMNILSNAVQAIENKGEITIRTSTENNKVIIAIGDSGKGMSEEVRKRVFEPFFTTKKMGEGAGLGLSICYNIISQHNGKISVNSEPGNGTEFVISLPVLQPANDPEQTHAEN